MMLQPRRFLIGADFVSNLFPFISFREKFRLAKDQVASFHQQFCKLSLIIDHYGLVLFCLMEQRPKHMLASH